MTRFIVPAALLCSLAACGGVEFDSNDLSAKFGPATNPKNPGSGQVVARSFLASDTFAAGPSGQHWTSPEGCTYSRTQAPGAGPVWYLVLNPHHVGMPNAHKGCPISVS